MRGRPEKLTPALQAELCKLLAGGIFPAAAASYVGISHRTYLRWLRRGRSGRRGPFFEFFVAVRHAIARAEAADVLLIGKAAQKDWRAAAFRLARRFPRRWGRGRELIPVMPAQLTPEELAIRLRQFMEAADAMTDGTPPDSTTTSPKEVSQ